MNDFEIRMVQRAAREAREYAGIAAGFSIVTCILVALFGVIMLVS